MFNNKKIEGLERAVDNFRIELHSRQQDIYCILHSLLDTLGYETKYEISSSSGWTVVKKPENKGKSYV